MLCKNLKEKSNEICGLAPHSMIIDIAAYQNEVGWELPHVIRYILIFLFGFFGLILALNYFITGDIKGDKILKKENIEFELPALNLIAKKSDGSMRDSLTILDRVVNYSNNKILH